MIAHTENVFQPVVIMIESEEELKHFVACLSISDTARSDAAAAGCGFHLDANLTRDVSRNIWEAMIPYHEQVAQK